MQIQKYFFVYSTFSMSEQQLWNYWVIFQEILHVHLIRQTKDELIFILFIYFFYSFGHVKFVKSHFKVCPIEENWQDSNEHAPFFFSKEGVLKKN